MTEQTSKSFLHLTTHLLEDTLVTSLQRFAEASSDCTLAFLTGSLARGACDARVANVNIYFVSEAGRSAMLRAKLSQQISQLAKSSRAKWGYGLNVDCHPYTLAHRSGDSLTPPYVTLTTKVLDNAAASFRFSLPPTIGVGWLRAYRVLAGDADQMNALELKSASAEDWMQASHEALSRYKNMLDHLPIAIDVEAMPAFLAEESVRYAEEALKDSFAALMPVADLNAGHQLDLLHAWAADPGGVLQPFFGSRGTELGNAISQMKLRLRSEKPWSQEEAFQTWFQAQEIWNAVWQEFIRRLIQHGHSEKSWALRVNAFV